jgi:hypothetical protein
MEKKKMKKTSSHVNNELFNFDEVFDSISKNKSINLFKQSTKKSSFNNKSYSEIKQRNDPVKNYKLDKNFDLFKKSTYKVQYNHLKKISINKSDLLEFDNHSHFNASNKKKSFGKASSNHRNVQFNRNFQFF